MNADLPALVVYARTSTDDLQAPEDSLAWQVSRAEALVKDRATIISVVHETDTSRSVPWARRQRASQLLTELYRPDRAWDGIVIGEPQRAFGSAAQVQDVLPRLADGGATLWVPEVGGPVDPGSEAHDIMLSLFGGLSKAERRRLQVRVRAAKETQAATGRFQGGRPPYGYRLESTGVPHPNADKARWGAELQRLAIDPETATWVQQIFAWRLEGLGYGTIAAKLDEAGVPCPSAHDRERNSHRAGRSWGRSTVAEIVSNPRYRGDDAYGRYRKVERLFDRHDPSAGFVSVLVPQPEDAWVMVAGTVPAIVSAADWTAAQPARAPTSAGGRRTDTPGRYSLRGLMICTACGHLMQGNGIKRAKQTTVHYRCVYRANYPGDGDHPKTLAVAEARILPLLDAWLGQVFDRDRLDQTIETLLAAHTGRSTTEPGAVVEARRRAADARARLDRAVAAIAAGVDPTLMVPVTRSAQADLSKANDVLAAHTARSTPLALTPNMIRSVLLAHQGLPGLLADVATPDERRQLYAGLGLRPAYGRRTVNGQVRELFRPSFSASGSPARSERDTRGVTARVGGGT